MAATPTRRTVEKLLRDYLTPLLVPRRFVPRGRTYRLASPTMDYVIVDVQASSGSWKEEYVFYVNLGIAPEPWLDYSLYRESSDSRLALPGIEHAVLFTRIDPPGGYRWAVDANPESADRVGPQIVTLLGPRIDEAVQLLDRETLLARARTRDLAGWTRSDGALLAALLAAKGPSEELTDLLDSPKRRWNAEFKMWARERAERSASHP